MRRLFLLLCVCILLCITLSGCASNNIKNAPYQNRPLEDIEGHDLSGATAKHLYQSAHELLVAGEPKQALRIYSEIQTRYPFSRYATQAALETVTAYYLLEQYSKVVSAADSFIKQHPRHPSVDYLYYMRGLANYHHNDPGLLGGNPDQRDLSYLKQAFADFRLLIRNYPNSVYANDAQQHMIEIRNRLADFELTVAGYYLDRHAYVAAARRASYVIRHYQRSTAVPRALEIMQQAYIKLGLADLARDARAILQASYPDYILHRYAFYHEDTEGVQNGGGSFLGWLWPAEDDKQATQAGQDASGNASSGWLAGKSPALIGQPGSDEVSDHPRTGKSAQDTQPAVQGNTGNPAQEP